MITLKTQYKRPLTDFGMGVDEDGQTVLVGRINGKQVGILVLYPMENRERRVLQVWTDKQYRRQGVATHLWEIAKDYKLNPVHDSNRTEAGTAWAWAVGD